MTNDLSTLESAIAEARTPGTPLHAAVSGYIGFPYHHGTLASRAGVVRWQKLQDALAPWSVRNWKSTDLLDAVLVVRAGVYDQWLHPLPPEARGSIP